MKTVKPREAILAECAEAQGFTVRQLLEVNRSPDLVAARRRTMVVLRQAGYPLQTIGRLMQGDRPKPMHHSTVLHHLEKAGCK